jgi:hypothetical protein
MGRSDVARRVGGAQQTEVGVSAVPDSPLDQALVTYLFAPVSGPLSEDAFGYLHAVWDACGDRLGMDQRIAATGAPVALPARLAELGVAAELPPTGKLVSARAGRHPQFGRCEALLRLHHEVLSLAVRLGPAVGPCGWRDVDLAWTEASRTSPARSSGAVAGSLPAAFLGEARIYVGLTHGQEPHPAAPDAAAVRLITALPGEPGGDWLAHGAVTRSGFTVWELADDPDSRAERRIVAVAPKSRDTRLSAWLWSRGTADMSPFGYYLLQTAKIRYMSRVWDDGRLVRATRAGADEITAGLTRLVREGPGTPSRDEESTPARRHIDRANELRRDSRIACATLSAQSTDIGDITQSVEIAMSNTKQALRAEAPRVADAGLFGDDTAMAGLLLHRLADERAYVERTLVRARVAEDLAAATFGPVPPAPVPPRLVTDRLAGADRGALLRALAQAFDQAAPAAAILESTGLGREFQAQVGPHPALVAWTLNLEELEKGRVHDPHRRLVRAALDAYPHNEVFQAAAQRLGLAG